MHFCFINMPIEYYSPTCGGAISTIIMETAKELLALGHEVTVMTKTNDEPIYDIGTVIAIDARENEQLTPFERANCRIMRKLLRWDWPYFGPYKDSFVKALAGLRTKPDATIVFNDFVSAKFIKEAVPGSAVYVWLQNENRSKHSDPSSASRRAIDKYIACSEFIRQRTISNLGAAPEQIETWLNCVDLNLFNTNGRNPRSDKTLRTLFVGRIDPNKGPDIAISAVEMLVKRGIDINLTVAGDVWFYAVPNDPRQAYKRDLVQRIESMPQAKYIGHVPREKMPELLRQHDLVFVLSRSNDPCPLVVLEAMASGCAVIASGRGGLPEICADAGIVIEDPDDVNAVAATLEQLATKPELLQEVQARSVSRAQNATWKNCADGLIRWAQMRHACAK
jgi:spore coat protein SA